MLKKCDFKLNDFVPNRAIEGPCGCENKCKKVYYYNSLGYRGEESNEKSKYKIFISGCSYTFGFGLNIEETWGYNFKKIFY